MNAVEAGLRLVFAITGQVEGEDSESIGGIRGRSRDLYVLIEMKRRETVRDQQRKKNEEARDDNLSFGCKCKQSFMAQQGIK